MVAADASVATPTLCLKKVQASSGNVSFSWKERAPLLSRAAEEVHPLPWFLSPEWTKRPTPTRTSGRRFQGGTAIESHTCSSTLLCCFNSSASEAGSESEMELGYLVRRPANASAADENADSSKQCIQFLVGLIVIIAMALILLIIFQPQPK